MRRSLAVTVLVLLLALLVGCSGSGSDSMGEGSSSGGGGPVPGSLPPGEAEGAPDDTDADTERQVVTTATAFLAVDDPAESAQEVSELVEAAGGRVEERTEQAASAANGVEGAFADLVVRVPSDELTEVLADLKELGDVESVSVSRSDVTTQAVDLDARISALQSSVARLQTLMDAAADTEALLAAEKALSERQEKLESMQSQRALLADQVELSTLTVHLQTSGVAPPGGPDGFLDGLATGWRALVAAVGAVVVVLGVLLPWLAVGGVLAGGVLVPIRWARRRSALQRPSAPVGPSAPPAPPGSGPPPGPPVPPPG